MVWKNMVGKEDLQKNGSVHESFRIPIGMESHYFNVFYLILFFTQEVVSRLKHAVFLFWWQQLSCCVKIPWKKDLP